MRAKFYIGCRVKKVRGIRDIGATGVVVGLEYIKPGVYPNHPLWDQGIIVDRAGDIQIKRDSFWQGEYGGFNPPSIVSIGDRDNWEPIVPEGALVGSLSFEELMNILESDMVSDITYEPVEETVEYSSK